MTSTITMAQNTEYPKPGDAFETLPDFYRDMLTLRDMEICHKSVSNQHRYSGSDEDHSRACKWVKKIELRELILGYERYVTNCIDYLNREKTGKYLDLNHMMSDVIVSVAHFERMADIFFKGEKSELTLAYDPEKNRYVVGTEDGKPVVVRGCYWAEFHPDCLVYGKCFSVFTKEDQFKKVVCDDTIEIDFYMLG